MATTQKRALLIGINSYRHFTPLNGCENDARTMAELLQSQFGFTHCRVLLSAEATNAGILAAFDQLVNETEAGDAVLFYYAGHGSQMPDREGDEPSGFDSTIIPVDSQYDATRPELNLDITDDQIQLFLQKLGQKTSAITVIVDACHSGTITRDAGEPELTGVRGVPAYVHRNMPPSPIPPELWPSLRGDASDVSGGSRSWLQARDHYVSISGCRDAELSGELMLPFPDGTTSHHGVLTYFLTQALRNAGNGATYRSVHEAVSHQVTTFRQGKQHPQMEGKIDRVLFGIDEVRPMRYLRLAAVAPDGNSVTLAAGASMGLSAGATVAIYAAGTVSAEGATPLAVADITAVRALDSVATVRADGRTGTITPDARAVVTAAGGVTSRRTVQLLVPESAPVAAAQLEAMRAAIASRPRLALVDAPQLDTLVVRPWAPSGTRTEWRWAITGADGAPAAPLKALGDTTGTCDNLDVLAQQWLALQLENPDGTSVLARNRPTVQLLFADSAQAPMVPVVADAGGLPACSEGTCVGVRVTNTHTAPLYISLLDFGMSGAIAAMYPPPGNTEALAPGKSVDLLTRPEERWSFTLPTFFPYAADGELAARDEGVETIKLFATTAPMDFEFLTSSDMVRAGGLTPLNDLESYFRARMGVAAQGAPVLSTRDGRPVKAQAAEDWTTATASFVLRRAGVTPMPPALVRELDTAGFLVHQSLPIPEATRDAAAGSIVLPPPPAGFGRVLMTMDESGAPIFHLPDDSDADTGVQRFTVPPPPPPTGERSVGALVNNPMVKELLTPLLNPVFGAIGKSFAIQVEKQLRPYRVLAVNTGTTPWTPDTDADWARLASGPALLLLHGLLGTSEGTFGALSRETLTALHAAYDGRVIAFDHPTIGHDAQRNAEQFVASIPNGTALTFDVLAHSQGGLVARVLAERQASLGLEQRTLTLRRVVMLGTPNAGTPLANVKQIGNLVKGFSLGAAAVKVASAAITTGAAAVSGGVLTALLPLVQQAAVGMFTALPGLESLEPNSTMLTTLTSGSGGSGTRYYGVGSTLTGHDSMALTLGSKAMGTVLGASNDLFVASASTIGGGVTFAATQELSGRNAVTHLSYLTSDLVQRQVREWLTAPV